ncbi:MAG: hypothetical protein QW035_03520 [Candidatus Anstonellales archaeon]
MASEEEVVSMVREQGIRWIDLQFTDVLGHFRNVSLVADSIGTTELKKGVYTDLSPLFGENSYLLPDPNTYAKIRWLRSTGRFIASLVDDKQRAREYDPRYSIEKAIKLSELAGFGRIDISPSICFNLLDTASIDRTKPEKPGGVLFDSREAAWSPSPLATPENAYMCSQPYDSFATIREETSDVLEADMRFRVMSHHHGAGNTGAQRLNLAPMTLLDAGDAIQSCKFIIRNIATAAGLTASFLAQPVPSDKLSNFILGISIWKGSENAFFESSGELSDKALYFAGGLIEHAEVLSLFASPSPNSYKAFSSMYAGFGNGCSVDFAAPGNRPDSSVVLFRGTDGTANPYLAISAVIAAGIDGMKKKREPNEYASSLEDVKKHGLRRMTSSFEYSLEAFESDNSFVKSVLEPALLDIYLKEYAVIHRKARANAGMDYSTGL